MLNAGFSGSFISSTITSNDLSMDKPRATAPLSPDVTVVKENLNLKRSPACASLGIFILT